MIDVMGTTTKTLYDTDFVEWTAHVAGMLLQGRIDEVDLEHIAEEIADLGKSERSAVRSQLHRMLMHLIKQKIQPEKSGSSWRRSIAEGRAEVEFKLEDSPSLRRYAEQNLERIWRKAVKNALFETGHAGREKDLDIPANCPYTLDDILDGDL